MNRKYLVDTLKLVERALATNDTVPIFGCFCFGAGNVLAYNDAIGISGPSEWDGTAGIHGKTLLGVLSNSKVEEVSIELDNDTAIIRAGRSVSKIPFQPKENFIFEIPQNNWTGKLTVTPDLIGTISQCLSCVSTDETQLSLHGITFSKTFAYACDGDSLIRCTVPSECKGGAFLPTGFCEAVLALWKELDLKKGTIHIGQEWVLANFGDWQVYGRLIEIDNPVDFEGLIKGANINGKTEKVPADLDEALSRARVFSDPESQKTQLAVNKNKLRLFTQTHMGDVTDEMPFKGHPDVRANVNASHLQKALKTCNQLLVQENCTVLEGENILMIVGNMD